MDTTPQGPAPDDARAEFAGLVAKLRRGEASPADAARIAELNRRLHAPAPAPAAADAAPLFSPPPAAPPQP